MSRCPHCRTYTPNLVAHVWAAHPEHCDLTELVTELDERWTLIQACNQDQNLLLVEMAVEQQIQGLKLWQRHLAARLAHP